MMVTKCATNGFVELAIFSPCCDPVDISEFEDDFQTVAEEFQGFGSGSFLDRVADYVEGRGEWSDEELFSSGSENEPDLAHFDEDMAYSDPKALKKRAATSGRLKRKSNSKLTYTKEVFESKLSSPRLMRMMKRMTSQVCTKEATRLIELLITSHVQKEDSDGSKDDSKNDKPGNGTANDDDSTVRIKRQGTKATSPLRDELHEEKRENSKGEQEEQDCPDDDERRSDFSKSPKVRKISKSKSPDREDEKKLRKSNSSVSVKETPDAKDDRKKDACAQESNKRSGSNAVDGRNKSLDDRTKSSGSNVDEVYDKTKDDKKKSTRKNGSHIAETCDRRKDESKKSRRSRSHVEDVYDKSRHHGGEGKESTRKTRRSGSQISKSPKNKSHSGGRARRKSFSEAQGKDDIQKKAAKKLRANSGPNAEAKDCP